jgi:hypothetical protein
MSFKIIGLLGKAGSGKDVVADFFAARGFVKVSFSDPMKRFAADAFYYTSEELWGASPGRNQEVTFDDQWWYGVMSRFSTAAQRLINELFAARSVTDDGYPDKVSAYLSLHNWLAWLREQRLAAGTISPRIVLQTLGTEWGRKLDPLLWARHLHQVIVPGLRDGRAYDRECGLFGRQEKCPGVIIPDHRFANEVDETNAHDGYMIKIVRPAIAGQEVGLEKHPSEVEQESIPDAAFHHIFIMPEGLDKVAQQFQEMMEEGVPW